MMRSRVPYKGIITISFIALLFVLPFLNAQTETKTSVTTFNLSMSVLNSIRSEINAEMSKLNQYLTLKEKEEFIKKEIDEKIFQRQGNAETNTLVGFNQAFAVLVTAYNNLNDDDTLRINKVLFGSKATSEKVDLYKTSLYWAVPDAKPVFVSP